jgi:hypothetical protein
MERQDFIDGLRELANIYEQKPWLEVPYQSTMWIFTQDAPTFIQQIAAFGSGAKKYSGEDIEFIPNVLLDLKVNCKREQICERKVVGKKLVPEQYHPAHTTPAHEEEIVEWECRPVLAAAKAKVESQVSLPPPTTSMLEDIPFE